MAWNTLIALIKRRFKNFNKWDSATLSDTRSTTTRPRTGLRYTFRHRKYHYNDLSGTQHPISNLGVPPEQSIQPPTCHHIKIQTKTHPKRSTFGVHQHRKTKKYYLSKIPSIASATPSSIFDPTMISAYDLISPLALPITTLVPARFNIDRSL